MAVGGLSRTEDLDVGQAGGVVDRDVHELPPPQLQRETDRRCQTRSNQTSPLGAVAGHGMPHYLDASELLDVDVDQLTGTSSLIALRGFQPEPAELAHPDPGQDPRHGRERHIQ